MSSFSLTFSVNLFGFFLTQYGRYFSALLRYCITVKKMRLSPSYPRQIQCFEEEMQASKHQNEKPLKSAIGQKGPHPPYSSSKQAAQKQLTTKKREKGEE